MIFNPYPYSHKVKIGFDVYCNSILIFPKNFRVKIIEIYL